MKKDLEIYETAFVTSSFRASDVAISKDTFAHLWANEKTNTHAKEYTAAVSAYEPEAHCLRNRYFYETIKRLFEKKEIALVINFGAGFSMYPFLLPEALEHIEIDHETIVTYKKDCISNWVEEGKLPKRNISYISADFNNENQEPLYKAIQKIQKDKASFLLIEGVLFFIDKEDTDRLFQLFGKIQQSGDYLGSVSFKKALEKTLGFKKMIAFIEKNLAVNQKFEYQTINDDFYANLTHYQLVGQEDHHSLRSTYSSNAPFDPDLLLNEQLYLLKKK